MVKITQQIQNTKYYSYNIYILHGCRDGGISATNNNGTVLSSVLIPHSCDC